MRSLHVFDCYTFESKKSCTEVGMVIAFLACWEMALAMLLAIPIFGVAQGRLMQTDADCLACFSFRWWKPRILKSTGAFDG